MPEIDTQAPQDVETRDDSDAATPSEASVSIDIESSPADVWHALTTNEGLGDWMGDGASVGSTPGDTIFVPDVVTGVPREGTISTYDESRHLEYTWWPEGDNSERSNVSITLEPCEVGTRVTVIETMPRATQAALGASATSAASGARAWRTALLVLAVSSALVAAR